MSAYLKTVIVLNAVNVVIVVRNALNLIQNTFRNYVRHVKITTVVLNWNVHDVQTVRMKCWMIVLSVRENK